MAASTDKAVTDTDKTNEVIDHQQNQDDFSAAFAEAVPDEVAVVQPTDIPVKVESTPGAKVEVAVPVTPVTPPVKEVVDDTGKEPDYKKLLAENEQRMKSWEGRLSASDTKVKSLLATIEELKKTPPVEVPVKAISSEEEEKILKAFTDEMGEDFTKPLAILIRKAIAEIVEPIKKETAVVKTAAENVGKTVETINKSAEERALEAHWQTIEAAHPDVEKLIESGEVKKWAESLPYAEATAALAVIEGGKATDVVKLLTQYKETVKKPEDKKKEPLPKVKGAAVKTGGPVVIPTGGPAKDDFAGTFEAITSTG